MAKKTTTTVVEDMGGQSAGTGPIEEPLSEETIDEMLALEDMAATLGAGVGQARVYKIERTGDAAFVGEFVAAELTESKLQEEFGGGKYVVKFLNSQKQYVKQRTVTIAEPRKRDNDLTTALAKLEGKGGIDQMAVLQLQLKMMESSEARNAQMITALIGALGNKNGGGSSAADIVQAVVALKGATDPAQGMFAGIESFVKLAQMMNGGKGDGKEDNAWSVIRDVAPGLVETIARGRGAAPAQPQQPQVKELSPGTAQPVVIQSNVPVQTSAPAAQPVVVEDAMTKQIRLLQKAVEFLKGHARKNKDVELIVDYVLSFDEGDNEEFDVLIGAIATYSFDTLASQDAEIGGPLRMWFQQFYTGVKNELSGSNNPAGIGGDKADTSDNGATSASSTVVAGS